MTISDNNSGERTHFYLDYRYCEGNVDGTIMFDHAGDIAGIKKGVNAACNTSGFVDIPTGSLVRIWEIQGYSNPTTDCFPYFWKNSLVLIPSINNNPFLVWGPNPDLENILGYKIYRAIHSVPNPKPIVYSIIATVDDETFDYVDYDVRLDEDEDYIWYYVKAYNSQTESPGSNVVTTNGGMYKKNKFDKFSSTGSGLNQNFPNPFNPSTQIKYSIALDADVTLKVYDMLGTEVAELVNETQTAGSYEVNFSSEGLSSGVYIYRIVASKNGRIQYTDSKRMILLR